MPAMKVIMAFVRAKRRNPPKTTTNPIIVRTPIFFMPPYHLLRDLL
jgi:hypothetical protein